MVSQLVKTQTQAHRAKKPVVSPYSAICSILPSCVLGRGNTRFLQHQFPVPCVPYLTTWSRTESTASYCLTLKIWLACVCLATQVKCLGSNVCAFVFI